MFKTKKEEQVCIECKKTFVLITTIYPSKIDDKRNSCYECPYCKKLYDIVLLGNEDVETIKK